MTEASNEKDLFPHAMRKCQQTRKKWISHIATEYSGILHYSNRRWEKNPTLIVDHISVFQRDFHLFIVHAEETKRITFLRRRKKREETYQTYCYFVPKEFHNNSPKWVYSVRSSLRRLHGTAHYRQRKQMKSQKYESELIFDFSFTIFSSSTSISWESALGSGYTSARGSRVRVWNAYRRQCWHAWR